MTTANFEFVGSKHTAESKHENETFQVIVRARGATWRLRLYKHKDPVHFESVRAAFEGSPSVMVQDVWNAESGWDRVMPDPCQECGEFQALCALCGNYARHFTTDNEGEGADPNATEYLCDLHGQPMLDAIDNGDEGGLSELGAYTETDGCACDDWG